MATRKELRERWAKMYREEREQEKEAKNKADLEAWYKQQVYQATLQSDAEKELARKEWEQHLSVTKPIAK